MSHLASDFEPFLPPQLRRQLRESASTAFGLRPNDSIGFTNEAWTRFAIENGGQPDTPWLSASILEHFQPSIRRFYMALFSQVRQSGLVAEHRYQCSSPSIYREFSMRVLPLGQDRLLLIHHLVVHSPQEQGASSGQIYESATGMVTVCCHCRHTRRQLEQETWDWVPAYLNGASRVSHGLCAACYFHYYGEEEA